MSPHTFPSYQNTFHLLAALGLKPGTLRFQPSPQQTQLAPPYCNCLYLTPILLLPLCQVDIVNETQMKDEQVMLLNLLTAQPQSDQDGCPYRWDIYMLAAQKK